MVNLEEPSELDLQFVNLLKEKKTIGYSKKLVDDYNLQDIIKVEYV